MSLSWADEVLWPAVLGVPLVLVVGSGLFGLAGYLSVANAAPGRTVRGWLGWGALVFAGGSAGWVLWAFTLASGDQWEGLTGRLVSGVFYAIVAGSLGLYTLRRQGRGGVPA